MNSIKVENVAVIGLGLLGGSLAMALKKTPYKCLGWTRRREVREKMLAADIIDETVENVDEILAKADLTVLCLPIPRINEFIKDHAAAWRPGSIVTDIGSVKEVIVRCGEDALHPRGVFFVGSHPMAGTEKSGPENAFPELYRSAEVFVTETPDCNLEALAAVRAMWQSIGTSVVMIGLRDHDVLVGHTSHISHVLALALTQAVLDCEEGVKSPRYSGCATGFKDTSRIASSSPLMWREIIENNQTAVLEVVQEFEKRWHHLVEIIENRDFDALEKEFTHGKELRDGWIEYKNTKHKCNW
jgi:prephenate dehydrogenase